MTISCFDDEVIGDDKEAIYRLPPPLEEFQNSEINVNLGEAEKFIRYDKSSKEFTLKSSQLNRGKVPKFQTFLIEVELSSKSKAASSLYGITVNLICDEVTKADSYEHKWDPEAPKPRIKSISNLGLIHVVFDKIMLPDFGVFNVTKTSNDTSETTEDQKRRLEAVDEKIFTGSFAVIADNQKDLFYNGTVFFNQTQFPAIEINLVPYESPLDLGEDCLDGLDFSWHVESYTETDLFI